MKLTIARKLFIGFGILVFLLVVIAVFSVNSLNRTQVLTSELIEYQKVVQATNQCKEAIFTSRVGIVQTYLSGSRSGLSRTATARKDYDSSWDEIREYRAAEKGELLLEIEVIRVEYDRRLDQAISSLQANPGALDEGDPDVLDVINANLDFADSYAYSTMLPALERLHEPELKALEELAASAERRSAVMTTLSVLFGLFSVVVGAASAFFISRGITRSSSELSKAADAISRGDLDVSIQISTGDEMEDLADSIDRMRNSLKAAIERLRR
ncbi:MAG: HAMP domain-containing protein [Anaerolineales bacterium]|nr:HAMP domain-containing protein [Anaerolineales bacterium]